MIDTTDIGRWLERYQAAWLSDDPEGTAGAPGAEVFHNLWLVTLNDDGRVREFVEYFMLAE